MNSTLVKRICNIILILLALLMLAFSSKQIDTEQGYYIVTIDFLTNPVKVGNNNMKLIINDKKSKKPVEKKLQIEVVPWMPAHEHTTREIPVVNSKGRGNYLIENLNFSMPGDWEVYVKIIRGRKEDTAVLNVTVIK